MRRQITLEQVIDQALATFRASIYVRTTGTVVAYYQATMTADIQPMTADVRTDLATGATVVEPWPVLLGVRIAWPRFGKFVLVGPLEQYDPVTLEAFDLDPTTAFAAGASNKPVAPVDVRRLGGNYWSATPTNLTGPIKSLAELASFAAMLGIDGDQAQILFRSGATNAMQLGATGGDFVALASKVDACMAAIATHTHPVPASGLVAPSGGGPCTGAATSSASGALGSLPATGSALIGAQ